MKIEEICLDCVTMHAAGLKIKTGIILQWIYDSNKLGYLENIKLDGVEYFHVSYAEVIKELPLLRITNENVMARYFSRLVSAGFLKRYKPNSMLYATDIKFKEYFENYEQNIEMYKLEEMSS